MRPRFGRRYYTIHKIFSSSKKKKKKKQNLSYTTPFLSSSSSFPTYHNLAEDYDEERAVCHVRRLLDIVACTTSFGASPSANKDTVKPDASKNDKSSTTPESTKSPATAKQPPMDTEEADVDSEISHSCPKLGSFYEFFSLSHLTPPLQCITFFIRFAFLKRKLQVLLVFSFLHGI